MLSTSARSRSTSGAGLAGHVYGGGGSGGVVVNGSAAAAGAAGAAGVIYVWEFA